MNAQTKKPIKSRHYFALPDGMVEKLDAEANAVGLSRGAALAQFIETAASAVGLERRDAPQHRDGESVQCDPERPFTRLRWTHPDGLAQPFPVYADIDGRAGLAFTRLKALWKVGPTECAERVLAFA